MTVKAVQAQSLAYCVVIVHQPGMERIVEATGMIGPEIVGNTWIRVTAYPFFGKCAKLSPWPSNCWK